MGREPLHLSVKAQLERADRCIAGASSLARLMHRLSIGAADAEHPPEDGVLVVYPDVGANETDRLWLALNELIDYAELSIEKVRGYEGCAVSDRNSIRPSPRLRSDGDDQGEPQKLHALTDLLAEGDLGDVDPTSIKVLGDYAGMAVIAIDEAVSKAEDEANV
ncbi:hypothetical protein SNK04_014007 [Fusarium graminearum]